MIIVAEAGHRADEVADAVAVDASKTRHSATHPQPMNTADEYRFVTNTSGRSIRYMREISAHVCTTSVTAASAERGPVERLGEGHPGQAGQHENDDVQDRTLVERGEVVEAGLEGGLLRHGRHRGAELLPVSVEGLVEPRGVALRPEADQHQHRVGLGRRVLRLQAVLIVVILLGERLPGAARRFGRDQPHVPRPQCDVGVEVFAQLDHLVVEEVAVLRVAAPGLVGVRDDGSALLEGRLVRGHEPVEDAFSLATRSTGPMNLKNHVAPPWGTITPSRRVGPSLVVPVRST